MNAQKSIHCKEFEGLARRASYEFEGLETHAAMRGHEHVTAQIKRNQCCVFPARDAVIGHIKNGKKQKARPK